MTRRVPGFCSVARSGRFRNQPYPSPFIVSVQPPDLHGDSLIHKEIRRAVLPIRVMYDVLVALMTKKDGGQFFGFVHADLITRLARASNPFPKCAMPSARHLFRSGIGRLPLVIHPAEATATPFALRGNMPDSPYYKPHQLTELQDGYYTVNPAYERLMGEYLSFRLANEPAYEYVRNGFVRRLGTLKRCIENVYSIYPPERSDKPSRDECIDLAINLQSFIFNVFGCIDNLAWIWVKEKQVNDSRGRLLRDQQIGLRPGCITVRETFSPEFQEYLASWDGWFGYLDNYRHALAHRIPLYVAPYSLHRSKLDEHNELERRKQEARKRRDFDLSLRLDAEQEALGTFTPWMMHSFSENAAPVPFHYQLLADWNTVVEMADKFLSEINPSV